jgi:hypothetical protein
LLADPSTLKKKTKKRNKNNNNNNIIIILTNGSTKPFFGGDERLHSSSDGKINGKKQNKADLRCCCAWLREREREREREAQNKAEMDGRSEHKCSSGSSAFPLRQLTGSPSDRRSNR